MAQRLSIMTQDGVELAALWEAPDGATSAVLLLHMMPSTKESWSAFADALSRRGAASLAIDFRGHGESSRRGGERLEYKLFSDAEHQAKRFDVEASSAWLAARGFAPRSIGAAGASIGANLAINFLSSEPATRAVIALSPGLDYHGVATLEAVRALGAEKQLMLAASSEDAYAFESVSALAAASTAGETALERFEGLGHGTTMFERSPEFAERAADWLVSRLKA